MARRQNLEDDEGLFGFLDIGSESEEDAPLESKAVSEAVVTGTDWTTETMLNQLSKGTIDLYPSFQRRFAWEERRQSRFIESLMLGLPIPPIVLAVQKDRPGRYIVIDGKQRLLSLLRFAPPPSFEAKLEPLRLKGLQVRSDLNNKTFFDLQSDPAFASDVEVFQNQPIRTVVIKNWPDERFLYTVFHRLNSGSVPLSPQELRQALRPGEFLDYINSYAAGSPGIQQLLGGDAPDFRMRDVELLIRFIAFRRRLAEYDGNLKKFLDETCMELNAAWPDVREEIQREVEAFEAAVKATVAVFGEEHAFRRWNGTRYEARFNRAVFDVMSYYFADEEIRQHSIKHATEVEREFRRLCEEDTPFSESLRVTTKSIISTFTRIEVWGRALERIMNVQVRVPQMEGNRIRA